MKLSRRDFITCTAAGVVSAPVLLHSSVTRRAAALTAQDIVDRIKQTNPTAPTGDYGKFKAGDPATVITGIATTSMATLPVLKQAVLAHANLVITCEPTFYSKADAATPPAGRRGGPPPPPDPIFTAKNEFIKNNGLVIWRLDQWRQSRPDPFAKAIAETMGWKSEAGNNLSSFAIPATTLDDLASDVKRKLNARGGIRVVGDPRLAVRKIGLLPGTTPIQSALNLMPNVDAVIAGEVREWESVEYARDKIAAGEKKSLILVGRVVSEEPGMNACAQWVRSLIPEVTTTWIPVGDPYWRPA